MRTTVDLTIADASSYFVGVYIWSLQVEIEGHSGSEATFLRPADPPELEITGLNIMGLELSYSESVNILHVEESPALLAALKEIVRDECEGELLEAIERAESERGADR